MLGIEHPFWSRVSNDEVYRKANMALNKIEGEFEWIQFIMANHGKVKTIRPISELIQERQVRLLGHLIREDDGSIMQMVTLNSEFGKWEPITRRRGKPRQHWLDFTMKRAYDSLQIRPRFDYDYGQWETLRDNAWL